MSVSVQDWSGAELSMSNGQSLAYPRPQVGIERLPARRMSNEPRESMNCKSCRKRKIKCNRLRPSCEACQIFQCSCIYDAVPKKRGPKTDVLESLLKRVDGLEAQLREKNDQTSPTAVESTAQVTKEEDDPVEPAQKRIAVETSIPPATGEPTTISPLAPATAISKDSPISSTPPEALLSTYFSRFHAKPFQILDESSIRQRMQLNQLPDFLSYSICAVASRYTPHPGGYQSAVKLSEDYAAKARREINTDEPTIDGLQATLLLVISFTAAGKGKKAYMLMTTAVGMAMALEIHTEMDPVNAAPMERETRRRLFWACYLLDRFMACGSKRPSLISDKTIMLRLPSWSPGPSAGFLEGEFFQPGSNLQYYQGTGKKSQGSTGMLIDITRILGITNRYLAAGGVRGDSHFPWHSLSNLSKIRQHLDTWASGTVDMFSSLESLFGQADSTVLVLSKLIYHLIHCLIYRPFLPINLAELAGSGQHESWQIEATNMCFLHANAIAELIELGKHSSNIEWPAFVGYCICTAGTVHIHGSHYSKQNGGGGEMNVFASSAHFLAREMQHLSELRYAWASVQHQRETLQGIYNAHAELVKTVTGGSMRFAPSFHLEDFFDRYMNIGGPGGSSFHFDAANLSLSDAVVDFTADAYSGPDVYAPRGTEEVERPGMKRKSSTFLSLHTRVDSAVNGFPQTSYLRGPGGGGGGGGPNRGGMNQQSPALITTQNLAPHPNHQRTGSQHRDSISATNEASMSALASFAAPNEAGASSGRLSGGGGGGPFSPLYNLTSTPAADHKAVGEGAGGTSFDPMFGTLPTNAFSSPAAWHAHDGQADEGQTAAAGAAATGTAATDGKTAAAAEVTTSPGGDHSPGANGQGDEKDPFLSLLEQLAENEKRLDRGGASDLDFFLAGAGTGG